MNKTLNAERGTDSQQRMVRRVCKICGDFEDEHHEPDYLEIPAGCVCDWRTWDYYNKTALPPACSEYKGDGKENCQTCEHDEACHTPNNQAQARRTGGVDCK